MHNLNLRKGNTMEIIKGVQDFPDLPPEGVNDRSRSVVHFMFSAAGMVMKESCVNWLSRL